MSCPIVYRGTPPTYATDGAGGADLRYAGDVDVIIQPGAMVSLPTGTTIELPYGTVGLVTGRSGLAFKHSILAHTGTIDADYRGELRVLLHNCGTWPYKVRPGDRIAQLLIVSILRADPWVEGDIRTSDTGRGDGGFGSTGR